MFSSGTLPFWGNGDPDEPSITRWSFEDFEEFYNLKLGLVTDSEPSSDDLDNSAAQLSSTRQSTARSGKEDEKSISSIPLGSSTTSSQAIYERHLAGPPGDNPLEAALGLPGSAAAGGGRVLKPLPDFANPDLKELAESITRDIFVGNVDVRWSDIKGLEGAKRLVKEAVVLPIKYPQYFTGLLAPWKGILLFGPPGTGKTMLAKAIATECNTTFFNISASSIVSKFRGESERLVRMLFELARHHAPSTIFLDEIDAILGQRGEGSGEHEASRRVKTELLVQMDGLAKSSDMVFLLAATNLPWELDHAMLRRLEKRILVPLPDVEAREAILKHLLPAELAPGLDYDSFVVSTEGYSGSDLRILCKEAAMRPVRRLLSTLESAAHSNGDDHVYEPVVPDEMPVPGPVTEEDMEQALLVTKPSANALAARYDKFNAEFGSQLTC